MIREAHQRSRGTYDSPRIHQELRQAGAACGLNRAVRIMQKQQITARPLRRFAVTTNSARPLPVTPKPPGQEFCGDSPDTAWSGDITYLWTGEGWLSLSVVLDLFSRRVVGGSMQTTRERSLAIGTRGGALALRSPAAGLVCHSDRGNRYASADDQAQLAGAGGLLSISRRGNCYDTK